MKHEDRFDDDNLLSRGQEIAVEVDAGRVVNVELQPGQMSLHHVLLFHGSEPNRATWPRVGFAIRYMPTHVRQLSPIRDSAMLVRGHDAYGHFDAEVVAACRPGSRRGGRPCRRHRSPAAHPVRGRRSPRPAQPGARRGALSAGRLREPTFTPTHQETRLNTLTARVAVALASLVVATGAAAQDIKIRIAHSLSTTEPAHLAAEFFAKNVAAAHQRQGADPGLPGRAARHRARRSTR